MDSAREQRGIYSFSDDDLGHDETVYARGKFEIRTAANQHPNGSGWRPCAFDWYKVEAGGDLVRLIGIKIETERLNEFFTFTARS